MQASWSWPRRPAKALADAVRGQMAAVRKPASSACGLCRVSTLTAQADDQIAKTRVTVDRSDVGVDLVLTPGARVAGRVIFEGTSRRPDVTRGCGRPAGSKVEDLNRRGTTISPREYAPTVRFG